MKSKKPVKDAIKSFIKAVIRTTVLFIALFAILLSGMFLGQREAMHDFSYAEVGTDSANPADLAASDASNSSVIDESDKLKWAEVMPMSPVSPLEGADDAQHR